MDGGLRPRNDDLARSVVVRRLADLALGGLGGDFPERWTPPTPIGRAMAPSPTGTAACMANPRVFKKSRGVADGKSPGRAKGRIFAQGMARDENRLVRQGEAPSCSKTFNVAIDTAIKAGCAFSVSVRVFSGPSNINAESFCDNASSTSSKTALAEGVKGPSPCRRLAILARNTNALVMIVDSFDHSSNHTGQEAPPTTPREPGWEVMAKRPALSTTLSNRIGQP